MSLLPAPINQVLQHRTSNGNIIPDKTSPTGFSPRMQDGFYQPVSVSPPNTDLHESPNSVGPGSDQNKKNRKFVCQYCSRKFLRAEHLRRHEITHTGDKPFRCPYCKEAFSRSDILKRHIAKCRAASGSEHVLLEPETPNAPPRRACDRCARLKVRCDFIQPCSRCGRQQMDCTYHRLNSNKGNESKDDRRPSQASLNGNVAMTQLPQSVEDTSLNSLTGINQSDGQRDILPFPGFRGSFSTQAIPSPPRMLPPPLSSPSMGLYSMQHSPQNQLNISPPNHPHDPNASTTTGLSPFNTYPNLPTPGPSLMDLSHAATNHQATFPQNPLTTNDTDVTFASSDPSDMIFTNQFSADDTFFNWRPFEYNTANDASLDYFFGPELSFFDMGLSPNDPQFAEIGAPPNGNTFDDPAEKSDKEEVPDEGLVATFDPGTGDGEVEHPPSRAGRPQAEANEYLSLIQVDPLQARVDDLVIAVFGSVENLLQQDEWTVEFFTTENVKCSLFMWAKRMAQHVPIIHLPTFSILTAPDTLLFVLCIIGRTYSRPSIDTERLQWGIDTLNKLSAMAKKNGELDLVNLEASYILVVLCTWHGNGQQRDFAKRLFRNEVVEKARRYGYCQVLPDKSTDGSDEAEWKAWIERETRIRFMMNIYLMDGGYVCFFNTRPVLHFQEVQLPFPCAEALWAAPTAAQWRKEMQKPRKRAWLPQTLDAVIRANLRPEDDHTDIYGKFLLIHGLLNYIWERQYELDCQTDPFPGDVINFRTTITRALNNWRQLWDHMIRNIKMDRNEWSRLGFFRNGLEYWYAAKLFLARPRQSGWMQPYDDDGNLFQVKRLLRIARIWIVRGEQKSALSKRDLRVPKLLEVLKIVVPELASVRIEEAPSVVPSPRPVWNSDKKEKIG